MRQLTSLLLMCLIAGSLYGQKSNLKATKSAMSKVPPQLEVAKAAVDSAIVDPVTSASAEAWYLHGQVYYVLGTDERTKAVCTSCLETAHASFLHAEELDTKKEYTLEIESKQFPAIIQAIFDQGVQAFSREDYSSALKNFESVIKISPSEMVAVQNAAFSAENAKEYVKAEKYYRQLVGSKEATDKTYSSLARMLLQNKDTSTAIDFLRQGRKQYPDSIGLLLSEINIYLATGNEPSAMNALQEAVLKDSGNVSLYLAMGGIYESMSRAENEGGAKLTLEQQQELQVMARAAYEKGLSMDPDNYELNFNLAAFIFNRGTEMENLANSQKSDKEYDRYKAQSAAYYKASEPYFLSALASQPGDISVMESLKMLYFRTKEDTKYNEIKKQLDALGR
ncbi:MAG: tetratricopeptide repeat protein [Bacteroidota bacterium]